MTSKSVDIVFLVWKGNKEAEDITLRISKALSKELLDFEILSKYLDIASYQFPPIYNGIIIAFGEMAKKEIPTTFLSDNFFFLPDWKKLLPGKDTEQTRLETAPILKQIIEHIKNSNNEEEFKTHVEIEDITIGKEDTDIIISDKELEYAVKLKKMLGNCKVIITKGDLRIEAD